LNVTVTHESRDVMGQMIPYTRANLPFVLVWFIDAMSQTSGAYFIFCNLKKPEPISWKSWHLEAFCIKPHAYLLCNFSG